MSTEPFPIPAGWLSSYSTALISAHKPPNQQFNIDNDYESTMVTLIYQDKDGNQTDGFIELGNKWYNPPASHYFWSYPYEHGEIPTDKACIIEITGNWDSHLRSRINFRYRKKPVKLDKKDYSTLSHKAIHIHDDNDTQAKAIAFNHLITHFYESSKHPKYKQWKDIITSSIKEPFPSFFQTKVTFQIGIMATTSNQSSTFTPLLTKPKTVLVPPTNNNNHNNNSNENNNNTVQTVDNNQSQQQLYYGTTITSIPSTPGFAHPTTCIIASVVQQVSSPFGTYHNRIFSIPLCDTAPEKITPPEHVTNQLIPFNSPLDEATIMTKWGSLLSSSIELLPFQQVDIANLRKARAFMNAILTYDITNINWYSSQLNSLYKKAIMLLETAKTLFHNHPTFIKMFTTPIHDILKTWGTWNTEQEQFGYYQELKHHTNQLSAVVDNPKNINEFLLDDYVDELPSTINTRITSLATQHDVQHHKTLYSYYGHQRQYIQPTQDCIDLALIGHHGLINTILASSLSLPSSSLITTNNPTSPDNIVLPSINNTIPSITTDSSYYKHHSNIVKQQIEMLHKQIYFSQQELLKRDESLQKKDEALSEIHKDYSSKLIEVHKDFSLQLQAKDQALTSKDQQLTDTYKDYALQLQTKDQALAKKDEALAAKDQQIMQLMQMLMQQQDQQDQSKQ